MLVDCWSMTMWISYNIKDGRTYAALMVHIDQLIHQGDAARVLRVVAVNCETPLLDWSIVHLVKFKDFFSTA